MTTNEAKKMKGKDPCWDGYKMLGTKPKGGKQVPNCIPEETMEENIARLVSNSIKRVTAVKPTPQQKADHSSPHQGNRRLFMSLLVFVWPLFCLFKLQLGCLLKND
jgi:hypothetical protein